MKTTINIQPDIMEMITNAAETLRISRTEVIAILMKRAMEDTRKHAGLGSAVQYQAKRKVGHWHRFHVKLKEDEYEYFLDLRKVLKMSVSLILANAVKKYLKEILKKNNGDNYRFKNYILSMKRIKNAIIWTFIWGCPPNLEKYISRN